MKRAAIGVRVHSGWGALVAVADSAGAMEVIDRRRVVITDAKARGAIQPYHFAERLGLGAAEKHLATCAASSERLALEATREIVRELQERDYRVAASAILLASGRPLPSLSGILASHALIHTAEGEFFRRAFRAAFERLEIRVAGYRERELNECARELLGSAAARLRQRIAKLGRALGPPWTQDQKAAALAAWMALTAGTRGSRFKLGGAGSATSARTRATNA